MMKIAVTGANGHVGVNLCKALLEQGHKVTAMVHSQQNGLRDMPVTVIKGDLLDKESLFPVLDGIEIVYHLAAKISINGNFRGMVERINVEGTKNMLEVAGKAKVKRFIHFSSIHAIRPAPVNEVLDEKRPLSIDTGFAYDRSKASSEMVVLAAAKNGLDTLVLSPTAIIGPRDPEPSLTGKAVIDLYNGQIPALVPGGYDWVDVRDVVFSAISAIENGRRGEKYLLSGKWVSLRDVSKIIGKISNKKTVDTVLPFWVARIGLPFITAYCKFTDTEPLYTSESLSVIHHGNRRISHEKASLELNHNPRPLEETMKDFIKWLKETGRI